MDILEAFTKLDDVDKVPLIFCEVAELVKLPPISVDSTTEIVMANSARLSEIGNKLADLHNGVLELQAKVVNPSLQSDLPLPGRTTSILTNVLTIL